MRSVRLALLAVVGALLAAPATAVASPPPPPKLPEPTYETVSQEVLIPMDDGVQLAATVALPVRGRRRRRCRAASRSSSG